MTTVKRSLDYDFWRRELPTIPVGAAFGLFRCLDLNEWEAFLTVTAELDWEWESMLTPDLMHIYVRHLLSSNKPPPLMEIE
jgi:hypothetical protein